MGLRSRMNAPNVPMKFHHGGAGRKYGGEALIAGEHVREEHRQNSHQRHGEVDARPQSLEPSEDGLAQGVQPERGAGQGEIALSPHQQRPTRGHGGEGDEKQHGVEPPALARPGPDSSDEHQAAFAVPGDPVVRAVPGVQRPGQLGGGPAMGRVHQRVDDFPVSGEDRPPGSEEIRYGRGGWS